MSGIKLIKEGLMSKCQLESSSKNYTSTGSSISITSSH